MLDVMENRRRDRVVAAMGLSKDEVEHTSRLHEESDLTDFENMHSRYSY